MSSCEVLEGTHDRQGGEELEDSRPAKLGVPSNVQERELVGSSKLLSVPSVQLHAKTYLKVTTSWNPSAHISFNEMLRAFRTPV